MSRLSTMARFEEPSDIKPKRLCDKCEAELYEGDEVEELDSDIFCSIECAARFIGVITKNL